MYYCKEEYFNFEGRGDKDLKEMLRPKCEVEI
jgi:hypothetical protein